MPRIVMRIMAVAVAISMFSAAQAAPIIRSASLFETHAIEGVSLSTDPRDAFDILIAAGYSAGDVTAYDDWAKGSLNLVRGVYGGPGGHSSVVLGRANGRLALITQTFNGRGVDVDAELSAVQNHFGIAADEQDCKMNAAGVTASCELRDADDPAAVTMKFSMTAQSVMILRAISRPQELKETLE